MDPALYRYNKYKLTCLEPTIIPKEIKSIFNISWEMDCDSDDVLLAIRNEIQELKEIFDNHPTLWQTDEYIFSNLLYNLGHEFVALCSKTGNNLYDSCLQILSYAAFYYKRGLLKAPGIACTEVYRIACKKKFMNPDEIK